MIQTRRPLLTAVKPCDAAIETPLRPVGGSPAGWRVVGLPNHRSSDVMSVATLLISAQRNSTVAQHRAYRPNLHKHSASQSQPDSDEPSLNPNPAKRNCVQPSPPHSSLPKPDTRYLILCSTFSQRSPPEGLLTANSGRNRSNCRWQNHPVGRLSVW